VPAAEACCRVWRGRGPDTIGGDAQGRYPRTRPSPVPAGEACCRGGRGRGRGCAARFGRSGGRTPDADAAPGPATGSTVINGRPRIWVPCVLGLGGGPFGRWLRVLHDTRRTVQDSTKGRGAAFFLPNSMDTGPHGWPLADSGTILARAPSRAPTCDLSGDGTKGRKRSRSFDSSSICSEHTSSEPPSGEFTRHVGGPSPRQISLLESRHSPARREKDVPHRAVLGSVPGWPARVAARCCPSLRPADGDASQPPLQNPASTAGGSPRREHKGVWCRAARARQAEALPMMPGSCGELRA
jgi:hypothetical protein